MFDFGFSELVVIGAVALVILGPERLPTVARTAGEWVGKAQRFVAQIKNDIQKEGELGDLKKIADEAKNLATDMRDAVKTATAGMSDDLNDIKSSLSATDKDLKDSFSKLSSPTLGANPATLEKTAAADAAKDALQAASEEEVVPSMGPMVTGPGSVADRSSYNDSVVYDEYADTTSSSVKPAERAMLNDSTVYDEYADETLEATKAKIAEATYSPDLKSIVASDEEIANIYGWGGPISATQAPETPTASEPIVTPVTPKKVTPTLEELAQEIENLRRQLQARDEVSSDIHLRARAPRRYASRPRIYR